MLTQQLGVIAVCLGLFCLAVYGYIERHWIVNRLSQWWRNTRKDFPPFTE